MSSVIYDRKALNNLNALYSSKVKRNPNYKLTDFYDEVDKGNMTHEDILFYKDTEGYDELEIVVRNKELQVSREVKSLLDEINSVSEEEMLEELKDILPNIDTTPKVVKEEKVVELKSNIEVLNVDKNSTTEQQLSSICNQLSNRQVENKVELEHKETIFTPKVEEYKELKKVAEPNKDILDMFDDLDNMYINTTDNAIINRILRLGEDNIGTKITEKILLPISGYTAYISGLTMLDKTVIRNTGKNEYEVNNKLYRMIYNHIVEIEPKKPDFETWKKMTAFNDAKILMYGLYAATYRNGNEFTIKCDNTDIECGTEIKVSTDPESILQVEDENIHSKIYDITTKVKTFEDVSKVSELGSSKKIKLPKSNLIIEVKNPSLQDHLDMIRQFPRENKKFKDLGEIYDLVMFTNSIYMVNVEETKATGKLCVYPPYTKVEEFMQIYSSKIDISEDELLAKGLNELLMKYMIQYEIPKFNCTSCGHEMGPYSADPTSLLFQRLSR